MEPGRLEDPPVPGRGTEVHPISSAGAKEPGDPVPLVGMRVQPTEKLALPQLLDSPTEGIPEGPVRPDRIVSGVQQHHHGRHVLQGGAEMLPGGMRRAKNLFGACLCHGRFACSLFPGLTISRNADRQDHDKVPRIRESPCLPRRGMTVSQTGESV